MNACQGLGRLTGSGHLRVFFNRAQKPSFRQADAQASKARARIIPEVPGIGKSSYAMDV
jgi:hypothetical protein